ncbi:MAG: hypothetical protein ACC645_07540, partial [Pirellulales bacterium]
MRRTRPLDTTWGTLLAILVAGGTATATLPAQAVLPGTGEQIDRLGDDFEDPDWHFRSNSPKSSYNIDKRVREPGGISINRRWAESAKRGQPDVIRRVVTPSNGLPGSQGALLLRSRYTGVPGRPGGKGNQDDLLLRIRTRMGGHLPASWSPSIVVHVYLPPWEQWENATGTSFALRLDLAGAKSGRGSDEDYWPGIFVRAIRGPRGHGPSRAQLVIRAARTGRDISGPTLTETGWWSL